MSTDPRDTVAVEKLHFAVTPNLLDALRAAAYQRRLTMADYVRGAVQARLTLDGVPFPAMPPKAPPERVVTLRGSPVPNPDDVPIRVNARTGERQFRTGEREYR